MTVHPIAGRKWSWTRFLLDTLFYLIIISLMDGFCISIGLDEPFTFTIGEFIRLFLQGVLWAFMTTRWGTHQEALFTLLIKKLK